MNGNKIELCTGFGLFTTAESTPLLRNRLSEATHGLRDREFLCSLLPRPMSEPLFMDATTGIPLWRGEFVGVFEDGEWKSMSTDDFIEMMGFDYFKSLRRLELR